MSGEVDNQLPGEEPRTITGGFVIPSAVTTILHAAIDEGGVTKVHSYPIIAWVIELAAAQPSKVTPVGVGGLLPVFPNETSRIIQIMGSRAAYPSGETLTEPASTWKEREEGRARLTRPAVHHREQRTP